MSRRQFQFFKHPPLLRHWKKPKNIGESEIQRKNVLLTNSVSRYLRILVKRFFLVRLKYELFELFNSRKFIHMCLGVFRINNSD